MTEAYEAARQREAVRLVATEIMDVLTVQHLQANESGPIRVTGLLRADPDTVYAYLEPRLRAQGYTVLLQEHEGEGVALLALPGELPQPKPRLWLNGLLFVLTVASTIMVGGFTPSGYSLGLGLAFSAAIMGILLAHEMGHYVAAQREGVRVSYPYFIPMPLTFIGTMGAFIAIHEPPQNRSALLKIGLAGPVAGMLVAVPVLLLGLWLSEVQDLAETARQADTLIMEGNSLLYAAAKLLVFGQLLPQGSTDVLLHPVAFAGWVGLLVTGLNLIPAGQFDGGHIYYALFGARLARLTSLGTAAVLLGMGFLWEGWFVWALLLLVLGRHHAPVRNELTPLSAQERLLAVAGIVLFVLVFIPIPFQFIEL